MVRVPGRASGALAINRDHEYRNSVIAAAAGVGAPVIEYLADESVLVIGYIDGRTFTDDDFSVPGTIERVASACRRLHRGRPLRQRLRHVRDPTRLPRAGPGPGLPVARRLPGIRGQRRADPGRARRPREPTVACNNDLLAGNFIDDGDRVRLIDYEYSGNNDACFELGNLGSECHLTDDQLEHLITSYYGHPLVNKVARARLQGLMAMYGWTLWASIQEATSDIDFEFWPWGLEKYERAVEMFRGPHFSRLIEDVQRED